MQRKLIDLVACPLCKSSLQQVAQASELVCRAERLAFPVRDGVPVLLESAARQISTEELAALTAAPSRIYE